MSENDSAAIDLNDEAIQEQINRLVEERLTAKVQEAVNKETEGLLKNRDKLLEEKKELKSRLDEISKKVPLDQLDDILKKSREAELSKMTVEERMKAIEDEYRAKEEHIKAEMSEKHKAEMAELKGKLEKKDAALRKHLIGEQLMRELNNAGGIPDLLFDVIQKNLDVVPDGDDYVVRVMENGNPRIGDSSGTPMTIAQLVEEYKRNPVFQPAFKATGASGGGAEGQDSSKGVSSGTLRRSEMTSKEKSDFVEKHGSEAFFSLPE